MYSKLALLVYLTHICAGETSSQGFSVLNQTLLSLNFSSGLEVRSVVNGNRLLLVWTQSNTTVFSILDIVSWSEIASQKALGTCENPEIEVMSGSSSFVIGCILPKKIQFFLISESGFQTYQGFVNAEKPSGLRLFQLSDSRVAIVFSAQDGDDSGVFFLFLNRNGLISESQTRANTFIQGRQQHVAGAANALGFAVAWDSYAPYSGIHIQQFTGTGVKTGPETVLFNQSWNGVLDFCRNLNGNFLLTYDTGIGNPGVFLTNIAMVNPVSTPIHGLSPPIWRISRSFASAVTTDRFLLTINYESPASILCSELLLFSPTGCFFASTSFCSESGDQVISSVSLLESGFLVLITDASVQGVHTYFSSIPTASVCQQTEIDPNFPIWRGSEHIEKTKPDVLIISTIIGGTFFVGICIGTSVCCFRDCGKRRDREGKLRRYQEQAYETTNKSLGALGSEVIEESA